MFLRIPWLQLVTEPPEMPVVHPGREPPSFKERYTAPPAPLRTGPIVNAAGIIVPTNLPRSPVAPIFQFSPELAARHGLELSEDGAVVTLPLDLATAVSASSPSIKWRTLASTEPLEFGLRSFAVHIENAGLATGANPCVWIGVSRDMLRPDQFCGGTPDSYAVGSGTGGASTKSVEAAYGHPYSVGDTVIVSIDSLRETVSFNIKGQACGIAFRFVKGPLYPCVSLGTGGVSLRIVRDVVV